MWSWTHGSGVDAVYILSHQYCTIETTPTAARTRARARVRAVARVRAMVRPDLTPLCQK